MAKQIGNIYSCHGINGERGLYQSAPGIYTTAQFSESHNRDLHMNIYC